jgi:histone acetyltransferase (RNA polymerase elongator complex component)
MFNSNFANNYSLTDIEGIFNKEQFRVTFTDDELTLIKQAFNNSYNIDICNRKKYDLFVAKELHHKFTKLKLIEGYRRLLKTGEIKRNHQIERFMKMKSTRGNSGVVVITTFMSGTQFGDIKDIKRGGCPENCHYCPFEKDADGIPTQPRSYLSTEPGNMRATQNKHHPVGQLFDRAEALEKMGHISGFSDTCSKVEMIISGGTFNFFPEDYVRWYVTSTYYALNIYYDYKLTGNIREMLSLEEEQKINETASLRMIGLTIETRPDRLFEKNDMFKVVKFFRELGVTRVQIGVQHNDNDVLKYVNRNCTNEQNKAGIRILKQNGFKTDIHLMLDLPMPPMTVNEFIELRGEIPEEHAKVLSEIEEEINLQIPEEFKSVILRDLSMIDEVVNDPDYQADQWKVYPTQVTPYSKILEWYNDGAYKPYAEFANGKILEHVIIYLKKRVHYYIRINRIIRDIPPESTFGGISCPDMRASIGIKMKLHNWVCKCIRCREVKNQDYEEPKKFVIKYESSSGTEYFISYENANRSVLYGMIRLRINKETDMMMSFLNNSAIIRELHVYGNHSELGVIASGVQTQHKGLGKKLIRDAEDIAYCEGCETIVVISGIGVREYYRKLGFTDFHTYLMKITSAPRLYTICSVTFFSIIIIAFCILAILSLFF